MPATFRRTLLPAVLAATGLAFAVLPPAASAGTASGGRAAAAVGTVPGAPTITSVLPGDGRLVVRLHPPVSNGGSPLVGYVVTATAGTQSVSTATSSTTVTVSHLTDGVTYVITARALNDNGLGPASAAVSATPIPGPVSLTLTADQPTFVAQHTLVTLAGRLTRSGLGVAGEQVFVTETYLDGRQVTLGQVVTDPNGFYSFPTTPLYNGQIVISALTATASLPSRVLVSLSTPRVSAQHGRSITVVVGSDPGFVTGVGRVERAQLLELDSHGHVIHVLQTAEAAQRVSRHGFAHGVNDITFDVILPHTGTFRLAVKVIGTPVNTGATSRTKTVRVAA